MRIESVDYDKDIEKDLLYEESLPKGRSTHQKQVFQKQADEAEKMVLTRSVLGKRYPKITIVTPSFNQGHFLEETIQSVLGQNYPNLEYMIIDGGSTDNSVDLIQKYSDHLTYWVSEPDQGQHYAIQKGFNRATGDIITWLCSDDLYEPGTLHIVANAYLAHPNAALIYGDTQYLYPDGARKTKKKIMFDYKMALYAYSMIPQPSSFMSRQAYIEIGGIDPTFQYTADYDLFLRLGKHREVVQIPLVLSSYRLHATSKTISSKSLMKKEFRKTREKILGRERRCYDKVFGRYYLLKAVARFYLERNEIVLSEDGGNLDIRENKKISVSQVLRRFF